MGIGIDIEEVGRFEKFLKDKNRLERLFSKDEIDYCLGKKMPHSTLQPDLLQKKQSGKHLLPKTKNF